MLCISIVHIEAFKFAATIYTACFAAVIYTAIVFIP